MKEYETIDEYIQDQPEQTREALVALKRCILTAAPDAVELFNYGIPAFALVKNGKREEQIMIAGYEKHAGFYPHPTTMAHFEEKLKAYTRGKGSVRFPVDRPIPCELVMEMVKYRKMLLR